MSWVASTERTEMLGYRLEVCARGNDYGWAVEPLYSVSEPEKQGYASGVCKTRSEAMKAAEEVARCMAKHSP